ncbi:CAP domain-containing protein [Holdemanella biformis]|uniref:CAP domain-containing protein n=1 Tax=Holdemanella biformis TaxID=1735 RepID=UPI0026DBAB18|nr:CAP domain-containing protein [Holdemanella biformis]
MKKTNEKILVSALAGMTVLQGANATLMSVCAQENNETTHASVMNVKMSQKDELESKLNDSKKNVDEKTLALDSAKGAASVAKKQVEILESKQDEKNRLVQQDYQVSYDVIMNELQPMLDTISDLESQINDAKKDLDEKISVSQKASEELDQAQKDLGLKKTELIKLQNKLAGLGNVVDLKSKLEGAKEGRDAALTHLNSAQQDADAANAKLQDAYSEIGIADDALVEATFVYNEAVNTMAEKEAIVKEKQAIVDQFKDENGIEDAKTELDIAKANLDDAKTFVDYKFSEMMNAQADYDNALGTYNRFEKDYENAKEEVNGAQINLNNANQKLESIQAEYDANQKEMEAKNNEILALNTQIADAQSEVDKAQTDYDKALNEYNSTSSPLEQAKKNLVDFESKYATELSRLTTGSKGYFESLGCSEDVLSVFKVDDSYQGEVAGYTHMGQAGDATSLENVKASIPYLREFNEIRKKEGLPELSVSMLMMAIAQVNANYAQVEGDHSSAYGTCENLAWGYGEAGTGASPFRGWYDYEKKQYDAGNHKFSEVGHYLNIVHPANTITGFALQKVNGVYAQEFGEHNSFTKDVILSLDEFETSFNNYYNNLKSVDAQHKALKDAVNNASGTTTKDDTALKNAESLLATKKNDLLNLQNQLNQTNSERDSLVVFATTKKNEMDQAKEDVDYAKVNVDRKKLDAASASEVLDNAKADVLAKENAKKDAESKLATAKQQVDALQATIDGLQDNIDNWDINKEKAKKALSIAEMDLRAAKEMESNAKENLLKATDAYNEAMKVCEDAQAKADVTSAALLNAENTFNKKNGVYEKVQNVVLDYDQSSSRLESVKTELTEIEGHVDVLKKAQAKLDQKISGLQSEIEDLNVSLANQKSNALPYEQMKSLLDDVMDRGTQVDLSMVENDQVKALLSQLSMDVDDLKGIRKDLDEAKNVYVEKYNLYLDAKNDLLNAKDENGDAMKALNEYLNGETKPETVTSTNENINTGVGVNTWSSMMSAMLAGLGVVGVLHQKRKEDEE